MNRAIIPVRGGHFKRVYLLGFWPKRGYPMAEFQTDDIAQLKAEGLIVVREDFYKETLCKWERERKAALKT